MLKKISLAVIGLTLGSVVNAGTMGPACTPGAVTVPCVWQGWDLGVEGLYLKPTYSGVNAYTFSDSTGTNLRNIANEWDWGYRLQGSYHFNTGNDVTLDWLHYRNSANGNGVTGGSSQLAPGFLALRNTANYNNQLDQVNLVLGQHTDVGLKKKLRFYGGLQYAHLESNSTLAYTAQAPFPAFSNLVNKDFKGIGPVVGIDYSYSLTSNLSVTANGEGSILVGRSRDSESVIVVAPLVSFGLSAKNRTITPTLQARIGFNYAYPIAQGILNLKAGYQALQYFQVMHQLDSTTILGPSASRRLDTSNFGLYGPYLGVHYLAAA